jgi:single-stranded DNA-binding protein
VGNLGRDAELRATPSGASVASFSIATTENWTGKDGQKQEQTEWHRIVLWGKTADTLQPYLTKGKQIYLEGRLQTRQWEKDGQKHYTTETMVDDDVCLYDPMTERVTILNRTASDIWLMIDGTRDLDQIAQGLASTYGVTAEQIMDDVNETIDRLIAAKLVEGP